MTAIPFRAVAPVSAVCAVFRIQPSAYPPRATKPDVAPLCGSVAGTASAEEDRLRAVSGKEQSCKRRSRTLRRCAGALRERQAQKKTACGRFPAKSRAASGEAGEKPGAFLRQPIHFCPQCGQFWAIKTALFCEGEKWIGADFRKKPRSCRCCRHYFGAFCF